MTFFSFSNIVYKWIEQVLFLSGSMPHGYPEAKNGNPSWNSLSSFLSTSYTAVWVNWWCYHRDKKREVTDEAGSGQTSQPIQLNAKEFMTLLTSIYSRFHKMESVLFLTIYRSQRHLTLSVNLLLERDDSAGDQINKYGWLKNQLRPVQRRGKWPRDTLCIWYKSEPCSCRTAKFFVFGLEWDYFIHYPHSPNHSPQG